MICRIGDATDFQGGNPTKAAGARYSCTFPGNGKCFRLHMQCLCPFKSHDIFITTGDDPIMHSCWMLRIVTAAQPVQGLLATCKLRGGTLYKSRQVIMLNGCFRDHQITDRDPRNQGSRCASTDHEIDPFTLVDGMLRLESSLSFAMPAESERDS
jgi:hypothetical protein